MNFGDMASFTVDFFFLKDIKFSDFFFVDSTDWPEPCLQLLNNKVFCTVLQMTKILYPIEDGHFDWLGGGLLSASFVI